jgi:ubiquinone/menaquinone biosynthesis C-methylase UbiE
MNMHEQNIEAHYEKTGMADAVMDAFRDVLSNEDRLKLEELSPVDEFHIRGREATFEMIHYAQFTSDNHILDVGCGVGGPSRWLAQLCGCRVTGLDVTEVFCELATLLAKRTGLENQVQYRHGSALDMPFEDDSFDGVWMQHVNMNIQDKPVLFSEIQRVLKPGGRLAFYEILADSGEALDFPVPWAQRPEISFLTSERSLKGTLVSQGFTLQSWNDVTDTASDFFRQMIQQAGQAAESVLAVRAQKDSNAALMTRNMLSNLEEGRIRVVNGIATA